MDWPIMEERIWRNTSEDGDRMRRRMAELLVHRKFPLAAAQGVVAMSRDTAERAQAHLGDALKVHVRHDWYYQD